jgi:urease accessory protein
MGFWYKRAGVAVFGALSALALPASAEAHLMTTGLGPVYDGVLHLLTSPEDLIPLLLLAVLAGMNGATAGRYALFVLPCAWLLSAVVSSYAATAVAAHYAPIVTILSLVLLGFLVALDRRLPVWLIVVLALLVGASNGALNGMGLLAAATGRVALVGIVVTTFVVMALAAAAALSLRATWARVALRVVGSWSVAIGLLLLGWTLRGVTA